MRSIKIITVGNRSQAALATMIDEYTKRLPKTITVTWQYLKHGSGDAQSSKQQESENILKALTKDSLVILLDETGKQLSSEQLSDKLFTTQKDLSLIIGGAYGVNDSVKQRADVVWSLSKLVFPHQLVKLILAEQIYRAYTISIDHPYHHS